MPTTVRCIHCDALNSVAVGAVGKPHRCQKCGDVFDAVPLDPPPPKIKRPEPREDLALGEDEVPFAAPVKPEPLELWNPHAIFCAIFTAGFLFGAAASFGGGTFWPLFSLICLVGLSTRFRG
jgi:hypothetical protein